jgi:serine acetyltransferase
MTLKEIIQADLYRITGRKENFIKILFYLYLPEFKFLFWFRVARYYYCNDYKFCLLFARFFWRKYSIKYGWEIPYQCEIKSGLKLMHRGG